MAFTLNEGAVSQVYKPAGGFSTSVRLTDSSNVQYSELWKTQPQVRTVTGFLARNISQLNLHLYRRISDTDRERVTDHPLATLLGRPNPFTTQYRMTNAWVNDCAIFDNSITVKMRLKDQPMALVRIDPSKVTPGGDNPFWTERFNVGKQSFTPDQVIHMFGYNPVDARWGMSPLETLRTLLAEEYQATLWREQLWRNGARTSGYLERPAGAPAWSDLGKEKFRGQWQAQYSGTGSRAGGTPILEDGMKYVPAGTTPRDAQYIESRKLTREEVAAAYWIPPPLVGILDHATYSNIEEQHKMLYQDCLGPWLKMIEQELMLQLLPEFPGTEDMYIEFNLAEKLKGSFEEQSAHFQTAVGGPWMTRNEARARVNLTQIPDGDQLIVPLNLGAADSPDAAKPLITTEQANTFGVLVRAGVDPVEAGRLAGLGTVQVIEGVPVTLRTPDEIAAGTRRS